MPGQYKLATASADQTKLTPNRLRRIVNQFGKVARYDLAALAGGINRQTLSAWRARGELDRDDLDDEVLGQVLELRDAEGRDGHQLPWDEIERQVGVDLSPFLRLVINLDEAQLDFLNEKFEQISEAARGRRKMVRDEQGQLVPGPEWQTRPAWQAAAFQLERIFPEFRRPRSTGPVAVEE